MRSDATYTNTYTLGPLNEVVTAPGRPTINIKYYTFNGQVVAMRKDGQLSYLHSDHLGSIVQVTNGSGQAVPSGSTGPRYYAYGKERSATTSLPTDMTFTGQRRDLSTGLMYYGARYYDPSLGVFISPDSIVPDPANPQSLNRYSYGSGNPVKYVDPTGHIPSYGDGPDECSWAGYVDEPAEARQHSLRGYARFLEKQTKTGEMSGLDATIDLFAFAASYGQGAVAAADDVSYALVGTGGTKTLLGGFLLKGKEYLGGASAKLNLANFGDTGFNPNYRDRQNQPYHFWANVNTTAQGGLAGVGIGITANNVHEMFDPSEALTAPDKRGTSWQDYFLSFKGMQMGLLMRSGELTVDKAGPWMRSELTAPAGAAYGFWSSTGTGWWPSFWMQGAVDLVH